MKKILECASCNAFYVVKEALYVISNILALGTTEITDIAVFKTDIFETMIALLSI